jgi:hypothetical protein
MVMRALGTKRGVEERDLRQDGDGLERGRRGSPELLVQVTLKRVAPTFAKASTNEQPRMLAYKNRRPPRNFPEKH